MVGVSVSVNLPLHHKVQKFSCGTGSPGWSQKKGRKMVVMWCDGGSERHMANGYKHVPGSLANWPLNLCWCMVYVRMHVTV